jgi:hypothetical protein
MRLVLQPERVLVLTALGSIPGEQVRALGFNVVERPATIGRIISAAEALLSRTASNPSSPRVSAVRKG